MRHVSRIRRVALHWLFDRINLDPKLQIRKNDTKHPEPVLQLMRKVEIRKRHGDITSKYRRTQSIFRKPSSP